MTCPTPVDALEAVAHGVLDQRLHAQERHRDRQHLGRHAERHLQPVAEAGLLEQQVALDRAQLLGERRVVAVAAEGVAGEVGELQQQLARAVGVGAHEAGDRAERVVDEVRADLGPQRPHLGLGEPGARQLELGQRELPGDPGRDLVGGAGEPGGLVRREGGQRADDAVVDDEGADDRRAHLAAGGVAGQVAAVEAAGAAALEGRREQGRHLASRGGDRRRPRPGSPRCR